MQGEQAARAPNHDIVRVSPALRVARAAGDLRRGAPVLIESPVPVENAAESIVAVAAETVSDATLNQLSGALGPATLLLTHARARTLKIPLYTHDVVSIALSANVRADEVRAIADPSTDLDNPLKGPFTAGREKLPEAAAASVKLAKLAGLLPAMVSFRAGAGTADLSRVFADDIANFDEESARTLSIVTRAHIPLEGAEDAELVAFRPTDGGAEHYAVLIGKQAPPVLTRIHSECFTGDLLGSLKCDCGQQLHGAIDAISKAGGGVLLYLAQEGRGIGLMNKLRTYRLQDQGFDTFAANERVGFEPDERLYNVGARMLHLLGISSVRLMTNNPAKVAALEAAGIKVTERVPHAFPSNAHNSAYLRAKKEHGGHLL